MNSMHKANSVVSKAIREGRLKRPKFCSYCSQRKSVVAHHDDYRKPEQVRWLCRSCHSKFHHHNKAKGITPNLVKIKQVDIGVANCRQLLLIQDKCEAAGLPVPSLPFLAGFAVAAGMQATVTKFYPAEPVLQAKEPEQ